MYFLTDNRGIFHLYPTPDRDGCLYNIQVVVKPKPIDFTIFNKTMLLPEYIVNNHSDIVGLKAVSILLSNRNNEFYDLRQARRLELEYKAKVNKIKTKRNLNYNESRMVFGAQVSSEYGFYRR